MTEGDRSRLDVIESKVDTILVKLDYVQSLGNDHEQRMRALERYKYAIPASLLVAVIALIIK